MLDSSTGAPLSKKANDRNPLNHTQSETQTDLVTKKRPSFLSDLRDNKKFKAGNSSKKSTSSDTRVVILNSTNINNPDPAEHPIDPANTVSQSNSDRSPRRQVNWLGIGSKERTTFLLNQSATAKERRATTAMKYGW